MWSKGIQSKAPQNHTDDNKGLYHFVNYLNESGLKNIFVKYYELIRVKNKSK